jgi:saccharopine dehydrogenase-like NADP-dependent oxidoreductase
MQHILLFGAGKSATCLIDYLLKRSMNYHWQLTVADGNGALAQSKIGNHPTATAITLNAENSAERLAAIQKADIVISLLPPALHYLVAIDCIALQKNLLTASYVDDKLSELKEQIRQKGLLFLCEMGLDPGIDHMSAKQLIDRIEQRGGIISSFKSHCGGLVAPESDTNPWHYKISWNPRNVVLAGKAGAVYKEAGQIKRKQYEELFKNSETVTVDALAPFAYYANRDSISYIPVYGLNNASTFIRTTLRDPGFCKAWSAIVDAGLTNDNTPLPAGITFKEWSKPLQPFIDATNREALHFLGLLDESPLPPSASTATDVLQYLLETKLMMREHDKDMVVMLHELEYAINGKRYRVKSSMVVKGQNNLHTAMAKTVGLPLGIAAKLILQKKISLTGLHIPLVPEIYEPVLKELAANDIRFIEKEESL